MAGCNVWEISPLSDFSLNSFTFTSYLIPQMSEKILQVENIKDILTVLWMATWF